MLVRRRNAGLSPRGAQLYGSHTVAFPRPGGFWGFIRRSDVRHARSVRLVGDRLAELDGRRVERELGTVTEVGGWKHRLRVTDGAGCVIFSFIRRFHGAFG